MIISRNNIMMININRYKSIHLENVHVNKLLIKLFNKNNKNYY